MSQPPELDPATGELWLAGPAFAALASHITRSGPGHDEEDEEGEAGWQLELLRQAGVLDTEGRTHPALVETAATIRDPASVINPAYAGRAMRGWVGPIAAALLLPQDQDGRHKLTGVPLSWLPEALARLVDLAPRPRPEPARPVPYAEAAFEGVRRHWRLRFHPVAGNGGSEGRVLEVVDTEGGLWVLAPDNEGTYIGWPSTPTTVWRLLTRLVAHGG